MANDTEEASSSAAEVAAAAPTKSPYQQLAYSPLRDESPNAFDEDKYGRARTHIAGLGHVSAKDVFKHYRRSYLTPFFGSNEAEPDAQPKGAPHPCQRFSREVHTCLEANHNSFAFCQTRVAAFKQCLREFSM
ncbi:hypothetical protein GH5_03236 [Leishmania sp. Ghana 2012 LV757]|uniref:hypothetical protein n=1 Tax=Leishmania sp. Ghana 2012 LV757 TaxID=2803181 RepID=UPI001B59D5E5|nr:hypothetical protein GH5_03236 [Leishmania sp. Ghana 2012 LV757]